MVRSHFELVEENREKRLNQMKRAYKTRSSKFLIKSSAYKKSKEILQKNVESNFLAR